MQFPVPPAAVARFTADCERLTRAVSGKLGIAVSGGPDSLALLLLACAAYGDRVVAATVDHGLRPESGDEARFVAGICKRLACPHDILPVRVQSQGEGVQGEARKARYEALRRWAADKDVACLLTAHHADDQAETLLMRLRRGSGIAGLSGIRARRSEGPSLLLARPLLGWTREDLGAVIAASGLDPVDDPSNRDMRFDRVAMREFLRGHPEFDPQRLARSASALAEAEDALQWALDRIASERSCLSEGEYRIDPEGLPREFRRRLLVRAIADLRRAGGMEPGWKGSEDVEGLLSTLEDGGTGTLAGIMAGIEGKSWRIRAAPPRRVPKSRVR